MEGLDFIAVSTTLFQACSFVIFLTGILSETSASSRIKISLGVGLFNTLANVAFYFIFGANTYDDVHITPVMAVIMTLIFFISILIGSYVRGFAQHLLKLLSKKRKH